MSTSASAMLRDWLSRRWSEQAKRIKRLDGQVDIDRAEGVKEIESGPERCQRALHEPCQRRRPRASKRGCNGSHQTRRSNYYARFHLDFRKVDGQTARDMRLVRKASHTARDTSGENTSPTSGRWECSTNDASATPRVGVFPWVWCTTVVRPIGPCKR
ncbi:hypothetical protein FA13DRAFT_1150706 [Coprinellus micaceus]|uniref:Uncharacterized protein n=1 Tax=Coprinellus micaceus TaxID=71717 RepID=A0A4Y7RJ04_COPMI|nr:hypothetical protein FA13DRAFT_1150706 [Coprinellus micaceus]